MIQNISYTHNRLGFGIFGKKKPAKPEKKMEDYQAYKDLKSEELEEFKKLHPLVQELVILKNTSEDEDRDVIFKIGTTVMHINAANRRSEIPKEDFLKAKKFLKEN